MKLFLLLLLLQFTTNSFGLFANNSYVKQAPILHQPGDTIFFDLDNSAITTISGINYFDLPVYIKAVSNPFSFDFWFKFNESKLTYNSTSSLFVSLDSFSNFDATSHFLQNTSSGPDITYQVPLNTNLVILRFVITDPLMVIDDTDLTQVNTLLDGVICDHKVLYTISSVSIPKIIESKFNVFPNPTKGQLNILVKENANVQLLNLSGKEVLLETSASANVKHEMNVETLSSGVYILKVSNVHFNSTERVVINK
jgi:hypothetical protein